MTKKSKNRVKCEDCKKREWKIDYCESALDFTHGFTTKLCRECLIIRIEKHIEDCKRNLKKHKRLLKTERRDKKLKK